MSGNNYSYQFTDSREYNKSLPPFGQPPPWHSLNPSQNSFQCIPPPQSQSSSMIGGTFSSVAANASDCNNPPPRHNFQSHFSPAMQKNPLGLNSPVGISSSYGCPPVRENMDSQCSNFNAYTDYPRSNVNLEIYGKINTPQHNSVNYHKDICKNKPLVQESNVSHYGFTTDQPGKNTHMPYGVMFDKNVTPNVGDTWLQNFLQNIENNVSEKERDETPSNFKISRIQMKLLEYAECLRDLDLLFKKCVSSSISVSMDTTSLNPAVPADDDLSSWNNLVKDAEILKEEKMKQEADAVLREVRTKQEDAIRMQKLLEALSKLRETRKKKGDIHGYVDSPQGNSFFSNLQGEFKRLLTDQLGLYRSEEEMLKVMMEESQAPQRQSRLRSNRELSVDGLKKQVYEILFGKKLPREERNEFERSFVAAEESVEILVKRRNVWDQFLVSEDSILGSSIPIGWVYPNPDPNEDWKRYQDKY